MNIYRLFLSVAICIFIQDVIAYRWNNNTREHLFQSVNANNAVFIGDEGFRWRNSFNFTINGQFIDDENWCFMPIVDLNDNDTLIRSREFRNNISPNFIHSHLAKIADKVKQINNPCASVTTAAVTIVVEKGGNYYAYSKTICNDSDYILVAKSRGPQRENNLISYVGYNASDIRNVLNGQRTMGWNLPSLNKYSCSEGQIIAKIRLNDFELMKRITKDLLVEARNQHETEINYNNVKLVVLHVGTTMDPCAVCTRCLVGLSKYINGRIDNSLRSQERDSPVGNMNNAKFLIEVSSNGHYKTVAQTDQEGKRLSDDKQDNFAAFGFGQCSHTECAGHDRGEADLINIQLGQNNGGGNALVIPYGLNKHNNWRLGNTFPPYVVFGRTYRTYTVGNAPNCCTEQGHTMHGQSNLQMISQNNG